MTNSDNNHTSRRLIPFTIDGVRYEVEDRRQSAADLLRLAGLDPAFFDLAEVPKEGPPRKPFEDDEIVMIDKDEKFVSIRESAPVT
ncbi:MAG: hypothetical protein F4169_17670 [Gammaproteobacteria bacterium]|nr:hypothetical protein [Acidimicrobiaceae bacterium]MYF30637.1 hypothetical protein [Gammaproteobacteria bacterium]MYJ99131.1 hypothetical protein [Acidimicrobiaceae bacterium]